MSRCVIFGAAEIKNYEKISEILKEDDFIIACDGGLFHLEALNQKGLSPFKPQLIAGDFDSHPKPEKDIYKDAEIIQLPCEKDDTDVFFAIKEALARGFKDFILFGVIGQRFDHSLCNISVLQYLHQHEATGAIYDDYSRMQLIVENEPAVLISDSYSYFSIMCIAGDVSGVTIRNAKYPLENADITSEYQFGISNEVLKNKKAEVSLKKGILLLIQVW